MQDLNPLRFRDELDETLRRYIRTALPISARYPQLRARFGSILETEATLVRGPYVETLPDFEKGATLEDLVDESILHGDWRALTASLLKRPLHRHQEAAIRRAAEPSRSYIVATGTGSGKTECFLFPVVDRLLRDPERHRAGVRTLIIYPLNALANDQLYFRIAPLLLQHLTGSGITFGRFTSAIKAGVKREEEEDRLLGKNDALYDALVFCSHRKIPKRG